MNAVVEFIVILIIVLGSVILHELAHGIMAFWLGDTTAKDAGRLSFNPIKHIDPYMSILVPVLLYVMRAPVFGGAKPVPINTRNLKFKEWGMALVAVAGPLMNFLLALLSFLIGHFSGLLYGENLITSFIFYELIVTNLGFMIFNLLPIPPLDGSRILYAISPDSVRNFLSSMEMYGIFVVYLFIVLLGNFFSSIMVNGINDILGFFYWIVGL